MEKDEEKITGYSKWMQINVFLRLYIKRNFLNTKPLVKQQAISAQKGRKNVKNVVGNINGNF